MVEKSKSVEIREGIESEGKGEWSEGVRNEGVAVVV